MTPPMGSARRGPNNGQQRTAVAPIPFTAAAHKHVELCSLDVVPNIIGANQQQRGPFEVPAYGFFRHILLEVSFSGATLGAGVLSQDWPWNVLQQVQLLDTNGA